MSIVFKNDILLLDTNITADWVFLFQIFIKIGNFQNYFINGFLTNEKIIKNIAVTATKYSNAYEDG